MYQPSTNSIRPRTPCLGHLAWEILPGPGPGPKKGAVCVGWMLGQGVLGLIELVSCETKAVFWVMSTNHDLLSFFWNTWLPPNDTEVSQRCMGPFPIYSGPTLTHAGLNSQSKHKTSQISYNISPETVWLGPYLALSRGFIRRSDRFYLFLTNICLF